MTYYTMSFVVSVPSGGADDIASALAESTGTAILSVELTPQAVLEGFNETYLRAMTNEGEPVIGSYEQLRDHYQALVELRQRAERKLIEMTPGTTRGTEAYRRLNELLEQEHQVRVMVLSHPDAPPQG